MLDGIEFGAQGTIDHAAAELDDQSADDGRIDLDVEVDVLAGDRFERSTQRIDMLRLKLFGHRDLGGDFAFVFGDQVAECLDHVAHREQPRFATTSLRKFAGRPPMPARSSTADNACNCSSTENTGLRTSRIRSGLPATSASKRSSSLFTASIAFDSRARSNSAVAYRPATPARMGSSAAKICARCAYSVRCSGQSSWVAFLSFSARTRNRRCGTSHWDSTRNSTGTASARAQPQPRPEGRRLLT